MSDTRKKFSPEFRDRAVRMVDEHRGDYLSEWAAISSIGAKVGCTTETLRRWSREEASRRARPAAQAVRDRRDDELCEAIKRIHDASFGLYGTRKVWHQLHREGVAVAKCTVERLMRAMGLAGVRRRKTTVTTVSKPKAPCPLNEVNREFRVSRPNALWVVDFTMSIPGQGSSTSPS